MVLMDGDYIIEGCNSYTEELIKSLLLLMVLMERVSIMRGSLYS